MCLHIINIYKPQDYTRLSQDFFINNLIKTHGFNINNIFI